MVLSCGIARGCCKLARTSSEHLLIGAVDDSERAPGALGRALRHWLGGVGSRSLALAVVAVLLLSAFALAQHRTHHVAVALAPREVPRTVTVDRLAARTAIEKANATWLDAYRTGDFSGMAALYTDDASLALPAGEPLEGRGNIIRYFSGRRDQGMSHPFFTTLDVVTMGDVAYETGTYGFAPDARGGLLSGDTGKYFVIWKAGADGTWRYTVGIWTSNAASKPVRR